MVLNPVIFSHCQPLKGWNRDLIVELDPAIVSRKSEKGMSVVTATTALTTYFPNPIYHLPVFFFFFFSISQYVSRSLQCTVLLLDQGTALFITMVFYNAALIHFPNHISPLNKMCCLWWTFGWGNSRHHNPSYWILDDEILFAWIFALNFIIHLSESV